MSGFSGVSGFSGFSGVSGFSGISGFSGVKGSDIRIKKDIRPFTDGLNVLGKIRPVLYKWNGLWGHQNDNKDVVGVIGQELESVAPYTIMKSRGKLHPGGLDTDILQVDSTPIIFLLVNAAKELKAMAENLERRLKARSR